MYVAKIHLAKFLRFRSSLAREARFGAAVLDGLGRFLDRFDSALLGALYFAEPCRQELLSSRCRLLRLTRQRTL